MIDMSTFTVLEELSTILRQLFDIGLIYITEKAKVFYENAKQMDLEKAKIAALVYYSRGVEYSKKKFNQFYDNNKHFRYVIDRTQYTLSVTKAVFQMRKFEPFDENWYSVSTLWKYYNDYKSHGYVYNDCYYMSKPLSFTEHFQMLYTEVSNVLSGETSLVDAIVSFKLNGKYVHRVCKKSSDGTVDNVQLALSDVKFLSIEYNSENEKNPIVLELNKNDYLVNNEILSCGFVARTLNYQIPYSKYDQKYKLKIMDNDLKTFEIDATQYIVLNNKGYTVMNKE
jgi:hypothetical protein